MHFIRSKIVRKRGHTNKMVGRWQGLKHLESGTVVASMPGYTSDSPSTFVKNNILCLVISAGDFLDRAAESVYVLPLWQFGHID